MQIRHRNARIQAYSMNSVRSVAISSSLIPLARQYCVTVP